MSDNTEEQITKCAQHGTYTQSQIEAGEDQPHLHGEVAQ